LLYSYPGGVHQELVVEDLPGRKGSNFEQNQKNTLKETVKNKITGPDGQNRTI